MDTISNLRASARRSIRKNVVNTKTLHQSSQPQQPLERDQAKVGDEQLHIEKGSRFFLWGLDCLYPALGQKIVYEEVGHTTGQAKYDVTWYASRKVPLPTMPIA